MNMPDFTKVAEAKIREALQNGDFDNLPGRGSPIDLTEYFNCPEELRATFQVLKNSGVVPPEVELMKDISALKEQCCNSRDVAEKKAIARQINEKSTHLNCLLERYRRRFKLF